MEIRRDLHRVPEIGFQEFKTQAYLLTVLSQYPKERIEVKTWETGIFVLVKGTKPTKTIGYRADIMDYQFMKKRIMISNQNTLAICMRVAMIFI